MKRRTQFRLLVVVTLGWMAWATWSLAADPEPFTLRVVDDVGAPIPEAVAASQGRQLGLTDLDGLVEVDATGPIEVSAPGHVPMTITLAADTEGVVDAVLKARVLRGRIVDESGNALAGAVITAGAGTGTTDESGRFVARGAEPGQVVVTRPAWEPTTFDWVGGPGETEITMSPLTVKAVHISGEAVEERLMEFVNMAETTELNALMVDLKDETGQVLYDSDVAMVETVGAGANMFDLSDVAAVADEHGLHLIGRLVAFQDPVAAINAPEISVWDEATEAPFSSRGQYFLDPTDPRARQYALDLATEACGAGVDEIQFDYVRFPDDRPESVQFDGGVTIDIRTETIRSFLREAAEALHPMGCAVAADIFGFVTTAQDDGGIGQQWVDLTSVLDVASPMLYPSHYGPGWYGHDNPAAHPADVVDKALADGISRLSRQVVVRPWLQDFGYDAADVRAQIEAAESYGLGWMLWNAFSNVTHDALDPET